MGPLRYPGPEANRWRGMLLSLTLMQTLTSISTSITAGAAANHAATAKSAKYANLMSTHIFVPFVIETSGAWNAQAIELTQEIGRRTTAVTGDPFETIHHFNNAIKVKMQIVWFEVIVTYRRTAGN